MRQCLPRKRQILIEIQNYISGEVFRFRDEVYVAIDIDEPKQISSTQSKAQPGDDKLYPSPAERAAFIKKFQSWRRDHAAG